MDIKFTTSVSIRSNLQNYHSFTRWMDIKLDDVVLGQPLQVRWRLQRFRDPRTPAINRKWTGLADAVFYVDGQQVHEHGNIAITDALDGTGQQTEDIIIDDQNLANAVYRFGRKWLEAA